MGDLGFGEILLIAVIAILLYGKDLPQVARKFAYYYNKLRRHLDTIKSEISRQIPAEDISLDYPSPDYGTSPPPPPTGLTATLEGNQVFLSWDYDSQAEYYNVKRSVPPEGSYATIASGITSTTYTDYPPMEGPTVSYVVSASNGSGESGDSTEVTVQLPASPAAAEASAPQTPAAAGSPPIAPAPQLPAPPGPAAAPGPPAAGPPEAAPAADPGVPPMS